MRKIAIINQKGGVGKTTTAINVSAGLALRGKKVLLLDMDPQGHVETYFPNTAYKKNMYELLTNGATVEECITPIAENFSVIKSSADMRGAELKLSQTNNSATKLLEKFEGYTGFDYIIIDCSPSVGIVTQNAMNLCDEAFIPVITEPLGLDGLQKIIQTINEFNEHSGHEFKVKKIIPTMYDRRNKICKECLRELQNEHYELVTSPIHSNSKLKEAPKHKKSIFTYAKSSRGAKDYEQLVTNILLEEETKTQSKHRAPQSEALPAQ